MCALRWSDVDLDRGKVRFWRSATAVAVAGAILKTTKIDDERTVTLAPSTVAALRELRRQQRERLLAFGTDMRPDDFLFPSRLDGNKATRPDSITHRWVRTAATSPAPRPSAFTTFVTTPPHPIHRRRRRPPHRPGPHVLVEPPHLDRYAAFVEEKDRDAADVMERLLC